RPDPGRVRLDSAQLVALEHAQASHAVCDRTPLELGEPRQLALVDRDDQLPATLIREASLSHVPLECRLALGAQPRLEGARRVVDAARVVARLVGPDPRLLVEDDEPEAGALLEQAARGREPENARAHHDDVMRPLHAASLYDRPA